MKKDVLLPCLLVVTGSLALVCGWQSAELRRLTVALKVNLPAAQPAVRNARAQTFVVVPHTAPAPDSSRLLSEDGSEFAAPSPFSFRARPAPASPLARLLNNPEFFQALQLHRQSTLDTRFAPLFRQLALNDVEFTAFKRLLAEKESAALDVIAVSESQPEGSLPVPILGASINAARTRAEGAIRSALGDERYAVYAEFEKSLPQRTVVAQQRGARGRPIITQPKPARRAPRNPSRTASDRAGLPAHPRHPAFEQEIRRDRVAVAAAVIRRG